MYESRTVDTFTTDNGMTARVVVDDSPDSPREWDNAAELVQVDSHFTDPDPHASLKGEVQSAWDHFRDVDLVARYLRMFCDVAAVESYDDPRSSSRVIGYVTHEVAERELLEDNAAACVRAELETYRQWADGEVYGVVVENDETGEDDSCWGIYDDDGRYVREVANDLAAGLESARQERNRGTTTDSITLAGVKVTVYNSVTEPGAVSIQVETDGAEPGQRVRVMLNDADLYAGDPEVDAS